jgi:predicted ATPase/signal transduction histidine kinase
MSVDSDYALELLREGADFTLHRGRERGNQAPVLAVTVAAEQSSRRNLRRLEHEYALAPELDEAWAVRPLALINHQGSAALILGDPGGEPLDRLIGGHPVSLSRFLRIAIGLAAALSQAHRQGLIHKDVKPANALVDKTGRVWLTGFGIASRLPRERQSPEAPEFIAGSLPYMAPEQTGRMNRSIDSRSDLYSLGVTLYELVTGSLPFTASDPMEWVHCHIARQPISPRERMPSIPAPVSAIIMKLLAKTAEARYQTAVGLERDLRLCLTDWETKGRIDAFPPGQHDKPDRLLIPETLYGRAAEINTLLAAFDRVLSGGRPELVLVSGYPGIGKSSVVNELHKPLVPPKGFFASGKFDQYKRDIPYATLAQALHGLIRPILAKNEVELGRWRDRLREALGPNGQLMVDLVPELKLVIGAQPPVPELPQQDAQSRFQLVFRRFIDAFTREHPLALFLDDLQWLDAATLELMAELLTHPDVRDVMLIGAYRDNEVSPAHPLMRKLRSMREGGAIIHDIVLAPLTRDDVEALITDSLHCAPGQAAPLARLVVEKTSGNPFFAIQFLTALFEEGLLTFDHAEARWRWDLLRIHDKGYTDNVVELMAGKLNRLPEGTRKALRQLACLGNSAGFAMLDLVYQEASEAIHEQLWEAARAGLIFRSGNSYTFIHDRVQEAAYSLIPEDQRAEAHLRIGMLMVSHTPEDELEDVIFEIVNQLNRGSHLLSSTAERERIAELNLTAGRRAKSSTAYASAIKHLQAGRDLLTEESWSRNYDLVFSIETLLAECELLIADMSVAEERLSRLAERARTAHDIALVTRLRVMLYIILGSDRGIDVFIEYQRWLGNEWSAHPTDEETTREYDRIMSLVEARTIGQLLDLPLVTNPEVLDVLNVLAEVVMVAIFTDANLLALVLCRMVSLSLEHGNCDASCFAYVSLGTLAWSRFGNYEAGFQFGKLGYDLVEKHGLHRYQARVYLRFALCIMPWRRHLNTGRTLIRRAFDAANRIGDLTFAAYSGNFLNTNLLAAGDPLPEVQREAENGLAFAEKARFLRVIDQITTQLALIRTLRGLTAKFGSFDDGHLDEAEFERHLSGNSTLAVPECWYWIRKLQARFFAGDYAAAVQASLNAETLLWSAYYYFETAEYHFFSALAHAGAADTAKGRPRLQHIKALAGHHRRLAIWAEACPENFEDRAALTGAEIARIEGRDLDAMRLYEQAIRAAHASGFVHNEAIAHELAGQFHLARGLDTAGHAYLGHARNCYDRWGATAKVRQLDERYRRPREEQSPASPATIGPLIGQIDIETVIRASQALSSEMLLPMLIERLMCIAVEHAGAERALLILIREDEPRIEAEATTGPGKIDVIVRQEPVTAADLPQSALHYVIRTQDRVLLDDASADDLYSKDDYIRRNRARSVLCLPIVKQQQLVGVVYLENNLAPFVFTPERVVILQLLASQAAISLENAALYTDRVRAEETLRQAQADLARIHRVTAMGELTASLAHELSQPISSAIINASVCRRWLNRDDPDLDEVRAAVTAIAADAQRAAQIIRGIRSQFEKGSVNREIIDFNEISRDTVALLLDEAARYTIAVRMELAADLPRIAGDRVQLQQVAMNLIINGIESMKDVDGSRAMIIRSQRAENGQILISVSDTGIGLPPQSAERIFDPFFTTKPHGTGMGLRISRSIVEAHGGRLWVSDTLERGATFHFTLPAADLTSEPGVT